MMKMMMMMMMTMMMMFIVAMMIVMMMDCLVELHPASHYSRYLNGCGTRVQMGAFLHYVLRFPLYW